jgi:2-polyprenyl-3-methyl-5-hydroxy-6-metoxy-1,4-benzoquinol methylase
MSTVEPMDPTCPICKSTSARWVAESHSLRIARCLRCGHGYVWPVPSATFIESIYRGKTYYQGASGSIGFSDYASLEPARTRMFNRHLDRIEAQVRGGRILDVGCANGEFLTVARNRGWQVFGADPSTARAKVEAQGIKLVGTTVRDADIEDGSLDAITFWDVLEHVTDPVADLTRARVLLKPRGVLALTVPDSSNLFARVSGRGWFGYKTAGEHLQFFTAASLTRALETAMFAVLARQATTWSCTLGFLADRAGLYLGAPGKLTRRVLASPTFAMRVVDIPQINQLAIGIPAGVPASTVGGAVS